MPKPGKDETRDKFLERCMGYPDMQQYKSDQRYAVCVSLWEKNKKRKKGTLNDPVNGKKNDI